MPSPPPVYSYASTSRPCCRAIRSGMSTMRNAIHTGHACYRTVARRWGRARWMPYPMEFCACLPIHLAVRALAGDRGRALRAGVQDRLAGAARCACDVACIGVWLWPSLRSSPHYEPSGSGTRGRQRNPADALAGRAEAAALGMQLSIATEAMLFALLLFSYFYLATSNPQWPPQSKPDVLLPLIMTVILVSSSFVLRSGEGASSATTRNGCAWVCSSRSRSGSCFSPSSSSSSRSTSHTSRRAAALTHLFSTRRRASTPPTSSLDSQMLGFITARTFVGHFDARRTLP